MDQSMGFSHWFSRCATREQNTEVDSPGFGFRLWIEEWTGRTANSDGGWKNDSRVTRSRVPGGCPRSRLDSGWRIARLHRTNPQHGSTHHLLMHAPRSTLVFLELHALHLHSFPFPRNLGQHSSIVHLSL
jgi:hypothetical protein